jgi:ubiquinone/menaquinone biosynthesis C-methylase UbiE
MERYLTGLATAFVRGRLNDPRAEVSDGLRAGLRLHKFKTQALPRVSRAIGILKGIAPANLLDVGSGRGTFLWPLLAAFPELPVTAIDTSERWASDLQAVRVGGVRRLTAVRMDAQHMAFADRSFDAVTWRTRFGLQGAS